MDSFKDRRPYDGPYTWASYAFRTMMKRGQRNFGRHLAKQIVDLPDVNVFVRLLAGARDRSTGPASLTDHDF